MVGSLTRRQRRPLWGWMACLMLVGLAGSLFLAAGTKSKAIRQASTEARLAAQTELATLLEPRDLITPAVGERWVELQAGIDTQILSASSIDDVRLYSSLGRILYADDPTIVGTRPTYLRNQMFAVASGDPQTQLRGGQLQTLVPIWLSPGGTVVVAEMSQALGPITSPATVWSWAALGCAVLLLGAIAMVVASSLAGAGRAAVRAYPPVAPHRTSGVPVRPVAVAPPVSEGALARRIEEQRRGAETRADEAERNVRAVHKQLKDALEQITVLERRLAATQSTSNTSDGELAAMREQLRQTTERLTVAELDARAVRERLALSQQELDEARGQLLSAESAAGEAERLKERLETAVDRTDELEELRMRVETAEQRADEMAHEMERMESELESATSQFHMTKLSEALREIDHDADEEHDEEPPERPVIIRGPGGATRKVG